MGFLKTQRFVQGSVSSRGAGLPTVLVAVGLKMQLMVICVIFISLTLSSMTAHAAYYSKISCFPYRCFCSGARIKIAMRS